MKYELATPCMRCRGRSYQQIRHYQEDAGAQWDVLCLCCDRVYSHKEFVLWRMVCKIEHERNNQFN